MTIDEAIKILTDYVGTGPEAEPVEFDKAVALGSEALKAIKHLRSTPCWSGEHLLPGETKD